MPTDLAIAFTTLFSVIFFVPLFFVFPFPCRISFCGKGKGKSLEKEGG
jgi:hypothetical protein